MTRLPIFLKGGTAIAFALCVIYALTKIPGGDAAPTHSTFVTQATKENKETPLIGETKSPHAGEIMLLSEQIELLRAEVNELRQQIQRKTETSTLTPAMAFSEPSDPKQDIAAIAEAEIARRGQMAMIESEFRNEPRAPQWADNTVTQIREVFSTNQIPQENLRDIECRANTCRVEIINNEGEDSMKSLPIAITQLGATLPSMTADQVDLGNGVSKTVFYFSTVQ